MSKYIQLYYTLKCVILVICNLTVSIVNFVNISADQRESSRDAQHTIMLYVLVIRERERERETDRQTETERDRDRDRDRDRERYRESELLYFLNGKLGPLTTAQPTDVLHIFRSLFCLNWNFSTNTENTCRDIDFPFFSF